MSGKLVILGEYNPAWETHRATNAAIEHSLLDLHASLETEWCSTKNVTPSVLEKASGFWIATGSPYKDMRAALEVIRHAREHDVPCLGTCQGFQHIALEYAQAFLGIENPAHEEYDGGSGTTFISQLSCSLKGKEMPLAIVKGSRAHGIYGSKMTTEKYYCSFGIAPNHVASLSHGPIRISGFDSEGGIRIIEYPDHRFMIGTLFVPQSRSSRGNPHLLITAFMNAVLHRTQLVDGTR